MDIEYIIILMEVDMKENLKIINKMDMENSILQMVINMKDNL